MQQINIGLLGLGVVGGGTYSALVENAAVIEQRLGMNVVVKKAVVRDKNKTRDISVPSDIITTDANDIINDPDIDIVCELMGGIEPARTYITKALENGKQVVTANKELLAKYGSDLIALAAIKQLDLHFEASVCGGIPIIQAIGTSLAGNRIESLMGIVNGTTNYILTKMSEEGKDFGEALSEAQQLGYAESDPTNDVEGHDAAYKLAILAGIAFSSHIKDTDVYHEGITKVSARDIAAARSLGYSIKLLAIGKSHPDSSIEVRVHPTLVPIKHPLALVSDVYNAVLVRGNYVGDLMFHGRGAGSKPTASSVVADIMDACRNLRDKASGRLLPTHFKENKIISRDEVLSKFYVRMITTDRLKGMASLANVFGNCGVSIEAVDLRPLPHNRSEWIWITHKTKEADFRRAIKAISGLPIYESVNSIYHVEE